MSRRFKTILLLAVILLQTTVLPHFTPLGIIPNYTLVIAAALAIICEDTEIVVYNTIAGFLLDLFTGAPTGLNTLLYMYISIGIIAATKAVYNKRVRVVLPFCFVASFVYEIFFGIFSSLLRGSAFYPAAILKVVLPVSVINTIIFVPVYLILSKVRFEKKRKGIKYERQI